jgi:anti-sigma B factor antagonist
MDSRLVFPGASAEQEEEEGVSIHVETRHDVAILKPSGTFHGGHETDKLREILRLSMADHTRKLIIDLGNVSWINSSAIGILVEAQLDYEKRGGRIILANLDKRISDILTITKLARLFEIGPGYPEALVKLST